MQQLVNGSLPATAGAVQTSALVKNASQEKTRLFGGIVKIKKHCQCRNQHWQQIAGYRFTESLNRHYLFTTNVLAIMSCKACFFSVKAAMI